MNYKEKYEFWCSDKYFDKEIHEELISIRKDEAEIEDRFYKDLDFGTGGLRGVIGAGTNRMNIYTVQIIFLCRGLKIKALQLHTIQDLCLRNLQMRQHFA